MRIIMCAVAAACLSMAGCTNSLARIVDDHRQQRINNAAAAQPLNRGANDGIGGYIAADAQGGSSASAGPARQPAP